MKRQNLSYYRGFSQEKIPKWEIPNFQHWERTHLPCDIYCNIARFARDDPSWKTLQQNTLHFLNENINKIKLKRSNGIMSIEIWIKENTLSNESRVGAENILQKLNSAICKN